VLPALGAAVSAEVKEVVVGIKEAWYDDVPKIGAPTVPKLPNAAPWAFVCTIPAFFEC